MPLYEYECPVCLLRIEKFFKSISEAEGFIPVCTCETKMKRVLSPSSFILKGDGWYSKRKPRTKNELENK